MGISGDLTGTPWHVDRFAREEDDPKRHRSRCFYYDKTRGQNYRCAKHGRCIGSAHCQYYDEKPRENKANASRTTKDATYDSIKKSLEKRAARERSNQKPFPVGSFVCHQTFGTGHVKSIRGNYVKVVFDSGKTGEFDIDICLKNRVLRVISL